MIKMWTHYCPAQRGQLDVGVGEPCSWCGARQEHKTVIVKEGQRFVDEAVVVQPRGRSPIEESVAEAINGSQRSRLSIVIGYSRTILRWMKPDGKGGLVPKDQK